MIARWPGTIRPSQTSNLPSAAWDFMPTFADLAGAPRPDHADGISLVPSLLGRPDRQPSREYLYWEHHMGKQQAVRMGQWKGVRFGGTQKPIELYDLRVDSGETRDVAGSHPDIVEQMGTFMVKARENSEYTKFWVLPERRQYQLQFDKVIFDQLEHGIRSAFTTEGGMRGPICGARGAALTGGTYERINATPSPEGAKRGSPE